MRSRNAISSQQWDVATDLFELGFKHAYEIAADLGVSPQTVMRESKRRGARKGRRAFETVADLEALLDRRAHRRAHAKLMAETSAAERRAAGLAVLSRMMKAIVDADERGDLTSAEAEISAAASALGVRLTKRTRARTASLDS